MLYRGSIMRRPTERRRDPPMKRLVVAAGSALLMGAGLLAPASAASPPSGGATGTAGFDYSAACTPSSGSSAPAPFSRYIKPSGKKISVKKSYAERVVGADPSDVVNFGARIASSGAVTTKAGSTVKASYASREKLSVVRALGASTTCDPEADFQAEGFLNIHLKKAATMTFTITSENGPLGATLLSVVSGSLSSFSAMATGHPEGIGFLFDQADHVQGTLPLSKGKHFIAIEQVIGASGSYLTKGSTVSTMSLSLSFAKKK
jgi:hypothetical protein